MKKVTISLPDDLARWLRVRAAADGRSVSEWIADLFAKTKRRDDEYEIARKEFLAVKPRKMEWVDGRKPTREELHDRQEDKYEIAMKEALAIKPWKMEWVDGRKPTREELHDRAGFR